MKTVSVTVSNRGYIVLPADIRKEMDILPGTKIMICQEDGRLILEPVSSFTLKLAGMTRDTIGNTPEAVDDFIEDQRKERCR